MPDTTSATLTLNGLTVDVTLTHTEHGPLLSLKPTNCDLDGEMPGEYYLKPLGSTWHSAAS